MKSSNKQYERAGQEVIDKHAIRETNRLLSSNAQKEIQRRIHGMIAEQARSVIYNSNDKAGNCGIMALVAMHDAISYANAPRAEVAHITVHNRNHESFSLKLLSRLTLTFGHSWLELGLPGHEWVVDPWAGLWCTKTNTPLKCQLSLANGPVRTSASGSTGPTHPANPGHS